MWIQICFISSITYSTLTKSLSSSWRHCQKLLNYINKTIFVLRLLFLNYQFSFKLSLLLFICCFVFTFAFVPISLFLFIFSFIFIFVLFYFIFYSQLVLNFMCFYFFAILFYFCFIVNQCIATEVFYRFLYEVHDRVANQKSSSVSTTNKERTRRNNHGQPTKEDHGILLQEN